MEKELKTSHLLFDEAPVLIRPELAVRLGLNEAIVLQQVHYWLENKRKSVKEKDLEDDRTYIEGRFWTYDSYTEWQKQFPWWSARTVERIFTSLEDKGILISGTFNKMKMDRTKWYTIDYDALDAYKKSSPKKKKAKAEKIESKQSDKLAECVVKQSDKLADSITTTCGDDDDNLSSPIPKTSAETSKPKTSLKSSSSSPEKKVAVQGKKEEKEEEAIQSELVKYLVSKNHKIKDALTIEKRLLELDITDYEFADVEKAIEWAKSKSNVDFPYYYAGLRVSREIEIRTSSVKEDKVINDPYECETYEEFLAYREEEKRKCPWKKFGVIPQWLYEQKREELLARKEVVAPKEKEIDFEAERQRILAKL